MPDELLLGFVAGMIGNIIYGLFNRKAALAFLPWLLFYFCISLAYKILTIDSIWGQLMKLIQKYPVFASWFVVIPACVALGIALWLSINSAVNKIDLATTIEKGNAPSPVLPGRPTAEEATKHPPDLNKERQNNKNIVISLSQFIGGATEIQMHCEGYNRDHTSVDPKLDTYTEFKEWNEALHQYLKENLDASYRILLEDNSGSPILVPGNTSERNQRTYAFLEQRKIHLREFIKKFE